MEFALIVTSPVVVMKPLTKVQNFEVRSPLPFNLTCPGESLVAATDDDDVYGYSAHCASSITMNANLTVAITRP